MAMHNMNSVLKYGVPAILLILFLLLALRSCQHSDSLNQKNVSDANTVHNTAAHDSAAESLDTLTAELAETRNKINEVAKENELLKKENNGLGDKATHTQDAATRLLTSEVDQLKAQVQSFSQKKIDNTITNASMGDAITTVTDLTQPLSPNQKTFTDTLEGKTENTKPRPYYTIPANATSVQDRLMTALVGRIPVKGVVTDPYPFKIVISDDNLAANGLRIPHLQQMIVSGYCEGDLNLVSVRGWVTSLTFVFDDGTLSTTTSNDNDMGNFTKANSLGYLSDKWGNPFIRGKLISNAPAYLSGHVALGAATGAATAYAESQTTHQDTLLGNTATSVTGSPIQFLGGQAASSAAKEVQQWWHDREEQSFDAIYVAPIDNEGEYVEIAVNFAKEIHIDYDPKGRKLHYASTDTKQQSLGLD